MDTIISVRRLAGESDQYWVTFVRADGSAYSEQWSTIPDGWADKVDYGHCIPK